MRSVCLCASRLGKTFARTLLRGNAYVHPSSDDVLRQRISRGSRKLQRITPTRSVVAPNDERGLERTLGMPRGVGAKHVPVGGSAVCCVNEEWRQEGLKETLDILARQGKRVDSDVYASLLQRCGNAKALWEGRCVHAHIINSGYDGDRYLSNLLVQMYGNCGNLEDALAVFDRIHQRNSFSWNLLIGAFAHNGHVEDARRAFDRMPHRDVVTYNAMIDMYDKCGNLHGARNVFDKTPQRNVVSWTAMIAVYTQNGCGKEALRLFHQMQLEGVKPNKITFITILDARADLTSLADGRENHAIVFSSGFESDVVVGSALVNMYGKCGSPRDARSVFDRMPQRIVVSWTAMITAYGYNGHVPQAKSVFDKMPERDVFSWTATIAAYSRNDCGKEALQLFEQMQLEGSKPNKITFISILDACSNLASIAEGKKCHANIIDSGFESDLTVGNALVNMYNKCGSLNDARSVSQKMPQRDVVTWNSSIAGYAQKWNLENARSVFDKMPQRDLVSWNTVIAAYAQNGNGKQALELIRQMQLEGMEPDGIIFTAILDTCASLSDISEGKESHASIIDTGFESDVVVGTALVTMYGKCGSPEDARGVFIKMPQQNLFSWTAIITAYAQIGDGKETLQLFEQMLLEGMKPNRITFISILSGCSHAGLVDDAWYCFASMYRDHGITPTVEHYACMLDLLGRAGRLDEVLQLINGMPFEPDVGIWMKLLGACRIYGNVEQGACAAERA